MKMLLMLALLSAWLARPLPAQSWLAATSTVSITADWLTTVDAIHKGGFNEINPILGRHRSLGRENTYMGACILANLAIGSVLPKPYRGYFWAMVTGFESAITLHQVRVGLRFNLKL